uniref:Uncharacterized protein n=1 Tax=Anolis carolinensis TaxID=28377 RepID=A0A803TLS4_ANOCA
MQNFVIVQFCIITLHQSLRKESKIFLLVEIFSVSPVKGQGAITEKLRSFSMQDLTAIQGDEPVGQRPYQTLPDTKRRGKSSNTSENLGYSIPVKNDSEDDKTDEEREGTYSEDEMFTQRGLRRTQSMRSVKTIKGRKEASKYF